MQWRRKFFPYVFDHHSSNLQISDRGLVDTPLAKDLGPAEMVQERLVSRTALKRMAQPEEIARCILFLLSDVSSYITASVRRYIFYRSARAYADILLCRLSMQMLVSSDLRSMKTPSIFSRRVHIIMYLVNRLSVS